MKKIIFLMVFFILCKSAAALSPEEILNNSTQEQQAQKIFLQVKCLTCKGQVIENSDSDFAYSLRNFIRKEIQQGKTEAEIKKILIKNFGSHILISSNTKIYFILIFTPIFLVLIFYILYQKWQIK